MRHSEGTSPEARRIEPTEKKKIYKNDLYLIDLTVVRNDEKLLKRTTIDRIVRNDKNISAVSQTSAKTQNYITTHACANVCVDVKILYGARMRDSRR